MWLLTSVLRSIFDPVVVYYSCCSADFVRLDGAIVQFVLLPFT